MDELAMLVLFTLVLAYLCMFHSMNLVSHRIHIPVKLKFVYPLVKKLVSCLLNCNHHTGTV